MKNLIKYIITEIGCDVMINFKAIGQRIRDERKNRSMTQENLAELLDISTEHLSRIETGSYRPSLILIEKISNILDIDEETLMFGTLVDANLNKELVSKIDSLSKEKKQAVSIIIDLIS